MVEYNQFLTVLFQISEIMRNREFYRLNDVRPKHSIWYWNWIWFELIIWKIPHRTIFPSNNNQLWYHRSRIAVIGGPTGGSVSTYTRTPSYGGSGTPMYGSATPGGSHGGRTPMYGSQTPMYDAGSRTPHYGGQTPSHPGMEDGSRTPGRSGAWDPTVTNTPSASR